MTTLTLGRSYTLDSMLMDTPVTPSGPVFLPEQALVLQNKLFTAFGDGADENDSQSKLDLADLVVDWIREMQAVEVVHPGPGDDEFSNVARKSIDDWGTVCSLVKTREALRQQNKVKMEHVEQAVAKALAQVVQTGLAGVSSHSSAITSKMAAWKKGIQDEGVRQLAAADEQINEAVQKAEATVASLLRLARSLYDRDRPKSEDEVVAAMMLQVEQHMESLALSGCGAAAGTGGTTQASPMDVCSAQEERPQRGMLPPPPPDRAVELQLQLTRTGLHRLDATADTLKEMMQYGLLLQRADGSYETPEEQAAENWDNSSIVFNAKLSKTQRRRGKYVMKTFRDLKALYGSASAKAIRERKKELGSEWWWPHPEMGESEEWECFKVYDSMEFEDDETSTQEHSFRAEGTLDAGKLPPAGSSGQLVLLGDARKGKSKGKTSLRKSATAKLSQISSKLTEARVLAAELPAATQMSEKMRDGYTQELEEGKQSVEQARAKLETWFARKLEDAEIVGPERAVYDEILREVESAFVMLNGKVKAVKTATAPPKEAKAKAKGRAAKGRCVSTPLHAYVLRSIGKGVTSFVGAREMLEAVNQEFQGYGMELGGAAGELIATSGKWTSNFQRDMLRKCKAAKVPVSKIQVPVMLKGELKKRNLPVVLPHEVFPWLVKQGLIPLSETDEITKFWSHARTAGMPTMGATDSHIPLYLWGDDARFTETHEDKIVVVAFGRVLETSKNALETVWPLFLYQQVVTSFNILFEQGVMVETPSGERKRVFAAVVQYQGDWKWHKPGFKISNLDRYPTFQCKAYNGRVVVAWLANKAVQWHLANWFNVTERCPRYLSVEEASSLQCACDCSLDAYLQLARQAVNDKMCLFPVKPKFHGWQEMALWAVKHRINPRTYHCFRQEDMVGSVVRIAQACHKRSVEEMALARVYLQLCYSKGTGSR
ncbi:unnamed protein product [Symbiodinium sp. CCMP2592]|nr:unnamed protein product [Symbiodinium sp. CCMP2592]